MPADLPPIEINLSDPESIAAKMPEVDRVVDQKRLAAMEAQKDFERWQALQTRLRDIGGILSAQPEPISNDAEPIDRKGSVERVVRIVNEHGGVIRTGEVRALAPAGIKPNTISWALWRAASDGLIRRVRKGYYEPNDDSQDQLDVDSGRSP